ncbi:hypothetical protein NLJ89_g4334 [Agrocybe chaxingu]|uniref:BTB domain-containing protein n=1 Tax=Agrocybe chaxingu TaxID=84603 RepID=A0A9W8MXT1_9AGAR|nr:hypothetical protein NLJ89_g4334 [Agrocybe chaxingu]
MAEDTPSSEFYWDNIFIKVEDKLFCVPRCEFIQSSEVFADMCLLPSGPTSAVEGRDRERPIVLEGYKKGEFACLLKVMYPTAGSLISGTNFELSLGKEEWVSVLKLSTIWNMKKIRTYAIHRLSTQAALLPMEKILLARAHKVAAWLDEGVTSLVNGVPTPELEDLTALGWETAARILWDDTARSCSSYIGPNYNVRITLGKAAKDMIEEMFGEEIKEYNDMAVA